MDTSKILEHFRRYIEVSPDEEIEILQYFTSKTFKKKEILLELDSRCRYHYFVINGCLRLFYLSEKGIDQTIQFAIENWWLTDYAAFGLQSDSNFSIQAVEKTEVMILDLYGQEELLMQFPKLERYFRLLYQKAYAASQFRIKYLFDYSREDMYHHFNNGFPEFTNRIPQNILASFLNMAPEYLSEIKAKKLKK